MKLPLFKLLNGLNAIETLKSSEMTYAMRSALRQAEADGYVECDFDYKWRLTDKGGKKLREMVREGNK